VREVHERAVEVPMLRVRESESPLRQRREVPVLYPPEIFAVYVPSHVDRPHGLMIGEHWLFLKLRESEWFVEKEAEGEPATTGIANEGDLRPLRERLDRLPPVLIPHQAGAAR
jgi:hypothetical protein